MTDEAKRFNIADHVGRYCLTYEQWLDHAGQDPEGYGMTKEQVIAEREHYNAEKASLIQPAPVWSITDSVNYTTTHINFVNPSNEQQGTDNGTPEKA